MMYSYPFFSFPHFRKYPYYSSYPQKNSFPSQSTISQYSKTNVGYSPSASFPNSKTSLIRNNFENDNTFQKGKENLKESLVNKKEKINYKKSYTGFGFLNNFLNQEDRSEEDECFEIFGLKLYYDDILLIGLMFFLYQEDVKDPYIFIALVLLLLS